MPHYGANSLNCLLECSVEGSFLPAAGVTFYADAVMVGAQLGEADAIVVLRCGSGPNRSFRPAIK